MAEYQFVDELVKEYLTFRGFTSTLKSFEQDLRSEKEKGFRVDRYRSLADVEHHEGELWESLVHTAKAVIYLLTSQHQQTNEKLVDMSRDWNIRRIKWMNQSDEKDQLLPDSEVKKTEATVLDMLSIELANVAKTCVTRLLFWEVSSYRQRYDEGADLHEVVIRCLEQILQTDKTEVNVAMVLIEQAWIFWYQADTDQLESAAKCCDKAAKSLNKLNEKLYLGVAYFLRFLVEQRLLQIQIQKEVEEEEKRVILDGRKEKEGIDKGCEILEENGRPIFTGLSLDTENKLSEYLVNSAQAFNQYQLQDLGAWYPVKDILDIQLGVADSLHIFNKPSTRLLENMLKVAEEHTQTDYIILGFIRLYRKNPTHYQQNITKLCELSKRVSSVGLLYQISLTVARNFLHLQKYDECEEILDTILSNPFTQTHSDKSMIICAEGYHIASLLRYQNRKPLKLDPDVNLESSYSPVASLGTLELELEAFKLIQACSFYYEEDRKLPGRQSPRILWLGPSITQLTLEIAEHLIKLQNHIGAPRELRSYIKWGLKFSQTNCFPLHTCVFLIESAKSHLLCDDEHQAFVQLNGVQDVLGTILKQRSKDKVVSSDVENRAESLPGGHQHLRSASPALFRNELVVPQFLDDKKDCDCHNCANILLSKVYAKFANTWARALMMSGEARAGHLAFKTSTSLLDKVRDKLKVGTKVLDLDPEIEEVSFHNIRLENLVHESESLAFSGDHEGALKIADSIQLPGVKASKNDIVIDWRLPEINPTLVFSVIELKSSLKLVNQKTVVDDLTVSLDKLCVNKLLTDYQGQCTPVADKPNKTMTKAPMKKMYPSLGIGDAEHLAKELEKLNMYNEEDETDQDCLPLKSKKCLRKKLTNLESMIENEDDFSKSDGFSRPKITLTADTPRRTKSRSEIVSVSVKKNKTGSMKKVLSPINSQRGKPSTEKKSVQIYVDTESKDLKTPAKKLTVTAAEASAAKTPGTTSKRVGRSTKKSSSSLVEDSSVERSTRNNASAERSTRKSSRSSAKRL